MYTGIVYNALINDEYGHRIMRVRLFELGHTFEEIDALNLRDMGDIASYWDGKTKGEAKMRSINKPKTGGRRKGR